MKKQSTAIAVLVWGVLLTGSVMLPGCGDQHQYGIGQDGSQDQIDFDKAIQDEEHERHHQLRQQQASAKPVVRGE